MNNIVFQHKIFTFRNCLWALSKYFTICCLAFNHQSVVWSYSAILCKFLAFDEVPWHSYKKYILYLKEYKLYMYNFVLYINLQVTANLGQLFLCQEDWMKISQAIYLYFILLEWVVVRVYNRSEITAAF